MKRGQHACQLNAIDTPYLEDQEDNDCLVKVRCKYTWEIVFQPAPEMVVKFKSRVVMVNEN